jgi:hypothetical protein
MFIDELTPLAQQLTSYPVAFLGGFVSGLLRLNLAEDPVKGWLDKTTGSYTAPAPSSNGNGPQSISIE